MVKSSQKTEIIYNETQKVTYCLSDDYFQLICPKETIQQNQDCVVYLCVVCVVCICCGVWYVYVCVVVCVACVVVCVCTSLSVTVNAGITPLGPQLEPHPSSGSTSPPSTLHSHQDPSYDSLQMWTRVPGWYERTGQNTMSTLPHDKGSKRTCRNRR